MFASKVTKDLQVDDQTVTIRKLSAKVLDDCRGPVRERARAEQLEMVRAIAGDFAEVLDSIEKRQKAKAAEEQQEQRATATDPEARYALYDRQLTLRRGIVAWSSTPPPDAAQIEDLEWAAADQIFRAIVDLSHPAAEERAEAGKGD